MLNEQLQVLNLKLLTQSHNHKSTDQPPTKQKGKKNSSRQQLFARKVNSGAPTRAFPLGN